MASWCCTRCSCRWCILCGYLFLHARSGPVASAVLASGFVMASVVPVYFVWLMPEVFNFSLVFLAYFCWLYKEVARPEQSAGRMQWLFGRRSDVIAAVLLGIATFSKVTNALLFAPIVGWQLWTLVRARSTKSSTVIGSALAFVVLAGGLFAINKAISGEWSYQGGARETYYFEFPFQNEVPKHELGLTKSREGFMGDVIFNPRTFVSNLTHNLGYFFVGRHTGLLGYFFPAMFAIGAFLLAPRRRPWWQWLVLASGLLQGLAFIIVTPYTWHGGGVGNRYFFSGYGVMLFVLPPIESLGAAFAPWVIGGLFVAPMVLNPVCRIFPSGGQREERSAPAAAGRVDARQRSPGEQRGRARAALVWRHWDKAILGFSSTSSMTTPTIARRTRASGLAAAHAPSSSSRPTSRSAARRSR